MKTITSFLFFVLFATVCYSQPYGSMEPTADPDVWIQRHIDGKQIIQYLRGNRAKEELAITKARNPEAFAKRNAPSCKNPKACKDEELFEENWTPKKDDIVVARWMSIPDDLASTTLTNVKGMAIWYPYDDANPLTYEGKTYVEDFIHPYKFTYVSQMKIPKTGAYSWVNYTKTWEKGDGNWTVDLRYLPDGTEVTNAWGTLRSGSDYRSCFLNGMVGGCLARGVVECAATGPGWAHCFAGKCATVMVGFAIGCIWVF